MSQRGTSFLGAGVVAGVEQEGGEEGGVRELVSHGGELACRPDRGSATRALLEAASRLSRMTLVVTRTALWSGVGALEIIWGGSALC